MVNPNNGGELPVDINLELNSEDIDRMMEIAADSAKADEDIALSLLINADNAQNKFLKGA